MDILLLKDTSCCVKLNKKRYCYSIRVMSPVYWTVIMAIIYYRLGNMLLE